MYVTERTARRFASRLVAGRDGGALAVVAAVVVERPWLGRARKSAEEPVAVVVVPAEMGTETAVAVAGSNSRPAEAARNSTS